MIADVMHVRFGVFEFDLGSRELWKDGMAVRVQAQPAQVLAVLVEHAGELVTREQLRQAVWGNETFVDFDGGLNYCIAQIRGVLGDSADSPRYVNTVPKQGYRFIAPVTRAEGVQVEVHSGGGGRSRAAWYLKLGMAGVLALTTVIWLALPAKTPTHIAVARFDNETGSAEWDRFAGGLTDSVVAELTTADAGRHGVIGNASLLRVPRAQRDLGKIGTSLGARVVILGQVQRHDAQIRVLAHLIRLPDQTHIWVVKEDRDPSDLLRGEGELAHKIAEEFLGKLDASPLPGNK